MLTIVLGALALLTLLLVGALAIRVHELSGQLHRLKEGREVERRHRELLTVQVERLEDQAAGVPREPEDVVALVLKKPRPRFPQ